MCRPMCSRTTSKNEYPQTVAVIFSKINTEHAAEVLSILPEDFALEVIQRMLAMDSVQRDVLEKIEYTLRSEFISNLSQTQKRDAHELLADIFNGFDRQTETRFLTSLEEADWDAAERIKTLMFTFDDLAKLDKGSIQTLLRNIEQDQLALAMKGASEPIREFFFSNMVRTGRQDAERRPRSHGPGSSERSRRRANRNDQYGEEPRRQGRHRNHEKQQ